MRVTQHLLRRFKAYHAEHLTWGSLHIALDDVNLSNEDVLFCLNDARERQDAEGVVLARILLSCTPHQRERISQLA